MTEDTLSSQEEEVEEIAVAGYSGGDDYLGPDILSDVTQLYFSPLDDNALWLCGDGGVYRYHLGDDHSVSFNGISTGGLQVSQVYRVQARRNLRFSAMQDDGINGSIDGGASWKPFHTGVR